MPLTIHVHHYHHVDGPLPAGVLERLEQKMSELSDKVAALKAAYEGASQRISEDVAELQRQVADLRAKLEAGTATPDDLAGIDSVTASLAAIDPVPDFPAPPPAA